MSRGLVVVGDATDHGGRVISGSDNSSINGRPIARLFDLVDCPKSYPGGRPHGVNKIVEGHSTVTVDGRPVALHGHRTECGCTLISSSSAFVG